MSRSRSRAVVDFGRRIGTGGNADVAGATERVTSGIHGRNRRKRGALRKRWASRSKRFTSCLPRSWRRTALERQGAAARPILGATEKVSRCDPLPCLSCRHSGNMHASAGRHLNRHPKPSRTGSLRAPALGNNELEQLASNQMACTEHAGVLPGESESGLSRTHSSRTGCVGSPVGEAFSSRKSRTLSSSSSSEETASSADFPAMQTLGP
jgi:hypothetical protein